MGLAADIGTWLAAGGYVGGVTGWTFAELYRPDDPDQVVVAGQFAGFSPDHKTDIERPGLQILVRAAQYESNAAEAKINAIFRAIKDDSAWPATINGAEYRLLQAQQSPFLLEFDENRRPVWAVNFNVWMTP